MAINWSLEDDVDDYIKKQLEELGLKKLKDYNLKSSMSDYMKEALKGSAKTKKKTNFGQPDFHIEKYKIPVIIENKLGLKKLISQTKEGIKTDENSIRDYAVNGALYYANQMIGSSKYKEVIAIGVAGDNEENIKIIIHYVYGNSIKSIKKMTTYETLDFLENKRSFDDFYKNCILTEEEKHRILISSRSELQKCAMELNKLMHNHNITAPQRVLYVSGMLLSMQDIYRNEEKIKDGLIPENLRGLQVEQEKDGEIIYRQINNFLQNKSIEKEKKDLMMKSFGEISKDSQRDEITEIDGIIGNLLDEEASINKQIFTYIFNNIYLFIDGLAGHLDIMGEMYSEFLKYALGDGKELGIVLTPPYVTKMMAQLLEIDKDSKVMDLATGSAGFLISAMELMIENANLSYGKDTTKALEKIKEIKKEQLLGVELNAEMFTLAATNMILRGDGSSNIKKGNTFKTPSSFYENFRADKLLLNPPFTFEENGMPFIKFGLSKMQKGGLGAIIIQDSAGSGKAVQSNIEILKKHTLIASIKMPADLFIPMAGVQTSIYIFKAGIPHDYEKTVKFIDFRNDGYKRTKRNLNEVDNPSVRYQDIIKIYKAGKNAKVNTELWNLEDIYVEDFISKLGNDWNFEQHKKFDTKAQIENFKEEISSYLSWEVSNILKNKNLLSNKNILKEAENLEQDFISKGGTWKEYYIEELFNKIKTNKLPYKALDLEGKNDEEYCLPALTAGVENQGLAYFVPKENATILKNVISVSANGANTGIMFYQPHDFTVLQDSYAIEYKDDELSEKMYLYLLVALQKSIRYRFDWSNKAGWEKIKGEKITLPFYNGKISFEYMEEYIEKIEMLCIKEIEKYLELRKNQYKFK